MFTSGKINIRFSTDTEWFAMLCVKSLSLSIFRVSPWQLVSRLVEASCKLIRSPPLGPNIQGHEEGECVYFLHRHSIPCHKLGLGLCLSPPVIMRALVCNHQAPMCPHVQFNYPVIPDIVAAMIRWRCPLSE